MPTMRPARPPKKRGVFKAPPRRGVAPGAEGGCVKGAAWDRSTIAARKAGRTLL
jgi:hypothetical protein